MLFQNKNKNFFVSNSKGLFLILTIVRFLIRIISKCRNQEKPAKFEE